MRKVLFTTIFGLAIGMSSMAKADESQHWAIRNGGGWTTNDNVSVSYWFTENGTMVDVAQLFIGPLLEGETDRPVSTVQFVGSGRTICLNAEAYRASEPTVKATAVPSCYRFPFGPLNPPTIVTP